FRAVAPQQSGILVKGAVRDIMQIGAGRKTLLVFAKNNDKTEIISLNKKAVK
ncbi:hypothetical protein IDJ77_27455, partial [Mucilaginibacter sp. ZT4R22]|nr:hypothetical protein [Mucilaginibacter pankratovii]